MIDRLAAGAAALGLVYLAWHSARGREPVLDVFALVFTALALFALVYAVRTEAPKGRPWE